MKITLLSEREDFERILVISIAKYLESRFISNRLNLRITKNTKVISGCFLINKRLNLIYPPFYPKKLLFNLSREYIYHPNKFSHAMRFIYVSLATSLVFRRVLCDGYLYIGSHLAQFLKGCFIPGNHAIHFINVEKGYCDTFLKSEFNKNRILQQLDIRLQYPFLNAPKIHSFDREECWFRQELLKGLPFNRISDQKLRNAVLFRVFAHLKNLYLLTRKSVLCVQWVERISGDINEQLGKMPACYSQVFFNRLEKIVYLIKNWGFESCINIALTHGDLQPGNIFIDESVDPNTFVIIDWEYAGYRSINYDWFVFMAESRTPVNFSERLALLIGSKSLFGDLIEIKDVLIFILEDLFVRLVENESPAVNQISPGFITFLDEVDKFLKGNLK